MSGRIVHAGIYPHPPVLVPAVGGLETQKLAATTAALSQLSERVKEAEPNVLLLISPHGQLQPDALSLLGGELLTGTFSRFGAAEINFSCRNDRELLAAILEEFSRAGLPVTTTQTGRRKGEAAAALDHGALVPLYFLEQAGVHVPLVHLTYAFLPPEQLFASGQAVKHAIKRLARRTALVISGDLSHRLLPGAPAGFTPRGREFDRLMIELLQAYDVQAILDLDEKLLEDAGECGYRSLLIGLGALSDETVIPEILSYEGPFGVGYLVADLSPGRVNSVCVARGGGEGQSGRTVGVESEHVRLARLALETYVRTGKVIPVPDGASLSREAAGVFVSIKIDGKLRGCMGTVEAAHRDLAAEIIANAISAGTADPRFKPVGRQELDLLEYGVDVLSVPEEISGPEELDSQKYGVIVQSGHRRGLLLPALEGVDSVQEQLAIALQKAGILPGQRYRIFRFTVRRYR
ncbi:MAG: 2-aminophenol 1,6-dioxygenase beta subunit [Syntrophomonadaceae bacterium]|nr:2-aminophenol 1,6-dioxygenase beta subunit [Bacillota bacterium]